MKESEEQKSLQRLLQPTEKPAPRKPDDGPDPTDPGNPPITEPGT
jgi:hypothetical protein